MVLKTSSCFAIVILISGVKKARAVHGADKNGCTTSGAKLIIISRTAKFFAVMRRNLHDRVFFANFVAEFALRFRIYGRAWRRRIIG